MKLSIIRIACLTLTCLLALTTPEVRAAEKLSDILREHKWDARHGQVPFSLESVSAGHWRAQRSHRDLPRLGGLLGHVAGAGFSGGGSRKGVIKPFVPRESEE